MNYKEFFVFLLALVLFCSCNEKKPHQPEEAVIQKIDSTSFWLESIQRDSTEQNFRQAIAYIENDSIRELVLAQYRKMLLNYDSFQKLKLDPNKFILENPCYAPLVLKIDRIHDKQFTFNDLFNETFSSDDYRARRFVVGDFNTVDVDGNCKGCEEQYPNVFELPELREFLVMCQRDNVDLNKDAEILDWLNRGHIDQLDASRMWRNLRDHVEQYRTEPMTKPSVIEIGGKRYCIGQTLCLCEIQEDTIVTVAKFVTSSKNAMASQHNQHDFDGQPRYYAPMSRLSTRYWDSAVTYDTLDTWHDAHMGFSSRSVIRYKGKVQLPNFMHITPDDAFPGAKGFVNGIHEFAVGGSAPGKYMGSPMSLGCVRLHDYPSKFIRWWTPAQAKMFIHYEHKRYIQTVKGEVDTTKNEISN